MQTGDKILTGDGKSLSMGVDIVLFQYSLDSEAENAGEENPTEVDYDRGFLNQALHFPKDNGEGTMKAKQSYEVIDPRRRRGRRAGEEGGPGTVAIGYMYRAARARGGDGWFRRPPGCLIGSCAQACPCDRDIGFL